MSNLFDVAKDLLGGADNKAEDVAKTATDAVDDASGGLGDIMDLIGSLGGDSVGQGDMDLIGIAKSALGKSGIGADDLLAVLKDGKIDANDLVTLGAIVSKLKK